MWLTGIRGKVMLQVVPETIAIALVLSSLTLNVMFNCSVFKVMPVAGENGEKAEWMFYLIITQRLMGIWPNTAERKKGENRSLTLCCILSQLQYL